MRLALNVPSGFKLAAVALSHGWYNLDPFAWEPPSLRLVVNHDGVAHDVSITQAEAKVNIVMTPGDRALGKVVGAMLRLDEELALLYALTDGEPRLAYARPHGAGRLLRAPTAFEDVIKMLLTTNCSWSLTRLMVQRLVAELGVLSPSGKRAFPTAQAMAQKNERFYRDVVKAGYRAPHLVKIAREVAAGALDLEAWRDPRLDDAVLRKQLLALPGIGPYAADNLLRLLGHYAYLGLDSWCRGRIKKLYPRARDVDGFAARRYRRYGKFAGLAMWLDLTADWHRETAPPA
jgi:N-glycosylase/DNA lyase